MTTTTMEITESNVTTVIPPEISDQLETQKIVKVIILSVNPRSGSTYLSGTQSFPSLMANLRQDISRVSSFSTCLDGTFSWRGIAPLRHLYNNPNEKSGKYKSSLMS